MNELLSRFPIDAGDVPDWDVWQSVVAREFAAWMEGNLLRLCSLIEHHPEYLVAIAPPTVCGSFPPSPMDWARWIAAERIAEGFDTAPVMPTEDEGDDLLDANLTWFFTPPRMLLDCQRTESDAMQISPQIKQPKTRNRKNEKQTEAGLFGVAA